uniref:peptidoglycan glycosyltransferase n=1 Tax=Magnetococcus massalia (strain MO-1) TaxID=451514 RepID=A0A1S7LDP5_MAGMO|nr:GT51 : candidate bifunctional family GT51 b-glycosyltransferase/PBP transpeptidase (candidate murein polymerase) [Candidatus Magnetococcus massalia]
MKRWPGKTGSWGLITLLLWGLVVGVALLDWLYPLPLPHSGGLSPSGGSVVVTDQQGYPLRAFADARGLWRYHTTPEKLSPLYLQALLAYEDRWFYHHPGVNPLALVRAAWQNLHAGRILSGGSTLTMQVARLLEPHPRTLLGKVRQIARALQLEWHLEKREILTLYLNYAPFGGTLEGVEAASRSYLGKSAEELSHAEAALLAVLPQAPSRLRPDRHPQRAQAARDKVLKRLALQQVWDHQTIREARMEQVWAQRPQQPFLAPLLARRLLKQQGRNRAMITSSIDTAMQRMVEQRLTTHLSRFPRGTSAAILIVENSSMQVRAYAGSAQFHDSSARGQVDMVRAVRSPGSTLKPFLYAMALEQGLIHSQSLLSDTPRSFDGYVPANFDRTFLGPISAADALARSRNLPAVDLLTRLGADHFSARLRQGGLVLRLPEGAKPNQALILGGVGVTLEQLTSSYAALARGGLTAPLRFTPQAPLVERRMLDEGAAWITRQMLSNHRPDMADSSGIAMEQQRRIAWKTGTSYGFRDAWAMGVTDPYTVGVWVGRPDGTPSPGHYGAISALPLLIDLADALPRQSRWKRSQTPPPSVARKTICWPLGIAPRHERDPLCHERRKAWVLNATVPPTLPDPAHWRPLQQTMTVDADSGERVDGSGCGAKRLVTRRFARWPARLEPWLSGARKQRAALPPWACPPDKQPITEAPLKLLGARDGETILPAGASGQKPTLSLTSIGGTGERYWLINGQLKGAGATYSFALQQPGDYRITVLDEMGEYDSIELHFIH